MDKRDERIYKALEKLVTTPDVDNRHILEELFKLDSVTGDVKSFEKNANKMLGQLIAREYGLDLNNLSNPDLAKTEYAKVLKENLSGTPFVTEAGDKITPHPKLGKFIKESSLSSKIADPFEKIAKFDSEAQNLSDKMLKGHVPVPANVVTEAKAKAMQEVYPYLAVKTGHGKVAQVEDLVRNQGGKILDAVGNRAEQLKAMNTGLHAPERGALYQIDRIKNLLKGGGIDRFGRIVKSIAPVAIPGAVALGAALAPIEKAAAGEYKQAGIGAALGAADIATDFVPYVGAAKAAIMPSEIAEDSDRPREFYDYERPAAALQAGELAVEDIDELTGKPKYRPFSNLVARLDK